METSEIFIPVSIGELYRRVSRSMAEGNNQETDGELKILNVFRDIMKESQAEKEEELFKKMLSISKSILIEEAEMQEFLDAMNVEDGCIDYSQVENNHDLALGLFERGKSLKEIQEEINTLYGSTTE
tara:strand:- start:28696 stop:29076 length:381 start_codon:yes stop_codon:yes gene_type:complete